MISVLFAEQFYYPEGWSGAQLPRDMTMHLARSGARVEVVCGSEQYAPIEGEPGDDPRACGVIITRVPRLLAGTIHQRKLIRQLLFYVLAAPRLLFRRSPGVFMTQTNPPLLRRRPFIIIAQDIYPEVMFAHGMSSPHRLSGRVLTRLFAWAYGRATRVVALGTVMRQRLIDKGVRPERITIISNWATGDEDIIRDERNELRARWGLTGRFVILYSGNIGIAHDVETAIEALALVLPQRPDVRLVFVGKGSRLADAERAVQRAGVAHAVQFHPLVPAEMLPHSLGLAHVALVTLRAGFEGLVVPSKLLGYMARSVPTLYVGPYSDVEQMLIDSGGGECIRNGEAAALAATIERLAGDSASLTQMGKSAEAYYRSRLSRERGLEKYSELVESVCGNANTRYRR
jgi:glycosyltransferase involved in cell wall biosynthesis